MTLEEDARRVRAINRMRLKKRGFNTEVSRRTGRRAKFWIDLDRHAKGMRTQELLESQETSGNPLPQEVYHEALFSLDTDPAAILGYAREFQKLKADPFLAELRPRLEALTRSGAASGEWPSLVEEIRRLDLLRRRDRPAAKEQLEELISGAIDRLNGRGPRRALGEISMALGVLAALQRLAGRRDDAVDLLVLSRPLAMLAKDPKVDADWYQKAAYLLVDLSRLPRAEEFVLRAHLLYDVAGARAERLRAMVDLAFVLTHADKHFDSIQIIEAVLPRLPACDHEYRFGAFHLLAGNFQALGDLRSAHKHLDSAIQASDDDLLARAYALWRRAELQVDTGDLVGAMASYREALPLYAKLTGAADLAKLAMEYATLLMRQGCRPELRALAADLSGWLEQLRGNLKLRIVIEDFQALIAFDELDEQAFGEILARVNAAKKQVRQSKTGGAPRLQPPGG